jgi:drug/metabolite transporter (DMT)-like permease
MNSPSRFQVYIAFALVYIFWGSTYLAIAVAVEHIPAALMTGLRFLVAGSLMLGFCALSGRRIKISPKDAGRLFVISFLLLTCGNTLLVWTEQFLPSGLASLFVCGVPIYVAVIEGLVLRGDRLSRRGVLGIVFGTIGLFLLLWPKLENPSGMHGKQLIASLVVIGGSMAWAFGSIFSRRAKVESDPLPAAAWQMTFAGIFNLTLATLLGDWHAAVWARSSLIATAYLVVFGSWVGFTAYIWLLEHVPTPKVATYAYVNPIVAVFLGWAIKHEHLDKFSYIGMVVIVGAVALVTGAKLHPRAVVAEQELVACESN